MDETHKFVNTHIWCTNIKYSWKTEIKVSQECNKTFIYKKNIWEACYQKSKHSWFEKVKYTYN